MGIDIEAVFLLRSGVHNDGRWHVASSSTELPRTALYHKYDALGYTEQYPVLVPVQTGAEFRRAAREERRKHGDYSYLCAVIGERLHPIDPVVAEDWDQDIGCAGDWVLSCSTMRLVEDLIDLVKEHQEEEEEEAENIDELWAQGNYGFLAKCAIEMSLGMVAASAADISSEFLTTRESHGSFIAVSRHGSWTNSALAKVTVFSNEDITGTLHAVLSVSSMAPEDDSHQFAIERSFSGCGRISIDVPPGYAKSVSVQYASTIPVSISFHAPFEVTNVQAPEPTWPDLWHLMLILRRMLPQIAARVVLQFAIPNCLDIAIGFIWDSQYEQETARLAAIENNERMRILESPSVKTVINAAKELQQFGCPISLPKWIRIFEDAMAA